MNSPAPMPQRPAGKHEQRIHRMIADAQQKARLAPTEPVRRWYEDDAEALSALLNRPQLTLTVAPEGEAAYDVDAEEFLFANREGVSAGERDAIRALLPGESITLGGGAAPYFTVSRRTL